MKTYVVEQYETHVTSYTVDAENEAHAIALVLHGNAEADNDGSNYVGINNDLGLPAESYPDIAERLRLFGIEVDDIVPSISRVSEVPRPPSKNCRHR